MSQTLLAAARETLRYRALAEILIGRELKARYRGTFLGFLWSFMTPLMMMGIYVLVFNVFMRVQLPHYAVFVLSGLLPWTCFVASLTEGMQALVSNAGLIKKVFLPAQIFPLVTVLANGLHYLLSLPVLMAMMLWTGVGITPAVLALPILVVLQLLFTYGLALALSSLAVQFRDLTHIVPNLLMMWFYVTPILYDSSMVPSAFAPYVRLNPLAGLINAYRGVCLLGTWPSPSFLTGFSALALLTLSLGMRLFVSRKELYAELV